MPEQHWSLVVHSDWSLRQASFSWRWPAPRRASAVEIPAMPRAPATIPTIPPRREVVTAKRRVIVSNDHPSMEKLFVACDAAERAPAFGEV